MLTDSALTLRATLFDSSEFDRIIKKATRTVARGWPDDWVKFDEADNVGGGDLTSTAWLKLAEIVANLDTEPPVTRESCFAALQASGVQVPEAYLVECIKNALLAAIKHDARYVSFGNPHETFDCTPDHAPEENDTPTDALLARIRERCRDETDQRIVALRLDGKSVRQTAETLDIAASTVTRRLAELFERVQD